LPCSTRDFLLPGATSDGCYRRQILRLAVNFSGVFVVQGLLTFKRTLTHFSLGLLAAGQPWLHRGVFTWPRRAEAWVKLPAAGVEGAPTPGFSKTFVHHFSAGLMMTGKKGDPCHLTMA